MKSPRFLVRDMRRTDKLEEEYRTLLSICIQVTSYVYFNIPKDIPINVSTYAALEEYKEEL
jgi:hypothetical protein